MSMYCSPLSQPIEALDIACFNVVGAHTVAEYQDDVEIRHRLLYDAQDLPIAPTLSFGV